MCKHITNLGLSGTPYWLEFMLIFVNFNESIPRGLMEIKMSEMKHWKLVIKNRTNYGLKVAHYLGLHTILMTFQTFIMISNSRNSTGISVVFHRLARGYPDINIAVHVCNLGTEVLFITATVQTLLNLAGADPAVASPAQKKWGSEQFFFAGEQ